MIAAARGSIPRVGTFFASFYNGISYVICRYFIGTSYLQTCQLQCYPSPDDLPVLPKLPLDDYSQDVRISSLAAALAKLNIDIPIEDLLKAIHEEDEARRIKMTPDPKRLRAALVKLALEPLMAIDDIKFTTPPGKFIDNPPNPDNIDPLKEKHHRLLVEQIKQAFPDGKVSLPISLRWLGRSQDDQQEK